MSATSATSGTSGAERDESEAERDDRNLAELLQELRVAGLGVQVLFGSLLSLPFTNRFADLSHGQRALYLLSLVLAAAATALLLGPAPTTGWCSAAARRRAWCARPT